MGRFCWNQDQETNRPSRPVSLGCGAKVTALSLTLKVPESERGVTDQCDRKHQMVSERLRLPPPRAHSPSCTPPAMPPQIIQFPEDQKVRAGESDGCTPAQPRGPWPSLGPAWFWLHLSGVRRLARCRELLPPSLLPFLFQHWPSGTHHLTWDWEAASFFTPFPFFLICLCYGAVTCC